MRKLAALVQLRCSEGRAPLQGPQAGCLAEGTVTEAATKAGLIGVTGPHMLRHGAATQMLENGVHIKAVADILGHSWIAITGDIYGHSAPVHLREALQWFIAAAAADGEGVTDAE
jgi:integrase